jgi:pyridoxal phosphate enzyme (YggS family)
MTPTAPEATSLRERLERVRARIARAERRHGRAPGSVRLLAVSKTHPAPVLRAAFEAGLRAFGESYYQEAAAKIDALADLDLEWHFIGPIQSNKTRGIAERFAWAHSVDREKIARRLDEHRPASMPPLQVCLQVNIDREPTKSGCLPEQVEPLAHYIAGLSRLRLRGLMAIPAATDDFERQRAAFARVRRLQEQLQSQGLELDTLSMGMSGDLEAAIAEGATLVRVGTALFGPRTPTA